MEEYINMFRRADGKGHVFLEFRNDEYDIFRSFETEEEARAFLKKIKK